MSDEWQEVLLDDVVSVRRDRVDPSSLGDAELIHYAIPALDETGLPIREPASSIASQKFRVAEPSVLVSMLNPRIPRVWLAAGATNAVCSTEFAVTAPKVPDLLVGFLHLVCQSPQFWNELQKRAVGTTGSRQRVKPAAMLGLPLRLPPLPVQRRIVDLMEHLDNQVAALGGSISTATNTLERFLDAWVTCHPPSTTTVGDHCRFRSGPSWAAADEYTSPGQERTPVVKITNTRPDGALDLTELVYVGGLPDSGHRLSEDSLIVIRTNGNRDRIGNVYRASPACIGFAVSAFQFAGTASNTVSRDFIYWFLRAPVTQRSMSEAASGTTGLGNLAVRWLNGLPVPAAEDSEVGEFVTTAASLGGLTEALSLEHQALTGVRAALLHTLLTGALTLPDSYDELLGVAS